MSNERDHHLGEDLAAMADGGGVPGLSALSPARRAELEHHVAGCAVCRAAIAQASLVLKTVDAARPLEPSSSFDAALFSRLDAVDRASFWERVRAFFTLPRIGVVAAAAAAVVLAVVFVPRESDELLSASPDLIANIDGLELAEEDLELYQDLELAENFDVLDDLEAIEAMEGEQG